MNKTTLKTPKRGFNIYLHKEPLVVYIKIDFPFNDL